MNLGKCVIAPFLFFFYVNVEEVIILLHFRLDYKKPDTT